MTSTKRSVLGVNVDAVTPAQARQIVLAAARERQPLSVSALAVHGVMTGVQDEEHRARLNALDLVVPDGQPVRWGLNLLHSTGLRERVYGPKLMIDLVDQAARDGLPVYLYGSTQETLDALRTNLLERYPQLTIAGMRPSRFRSMSSEEQRELQRAIADSGAQLVFVGLGCPRQEIFVYENTRAIGLPLLAVGAAFDYHAGLLTEPPAWVQRWGLQWLVRLAQNPRRLWRRYVLLNPAYLARLAAQKIGIWTPRPADASPHETRVG